MQLGLHSVKASESVNQSQPCLCSLTLLLDWSNSTNKNNTSFQIQVHGTYKMQLSGQDKVSEGDFAAFSTMDTLVVVDIETL